MENNMPTKSEDKNTVAPEVSRPIPPVSPAPPPTAAEPFLARRVAAKAPAKTQFVKSRAQHRLAKRTWRLRRFQLGI